MFDSQSDVAAVVYGPRDEPDRLLGAFADDLRRRGFRPAGVIQHGHRRPWENIGMRLVSLPDDEVLLLAHDLDTPTAGCRPDARQMAAARHKVSAAIEGGADLVIINRFGRLEASGLGFADEIRAALAADIPVLITVPEQRFAAWTHFSRGMGVKLACARAPLDAWWCGVSAGLAAQPVAATFCEIAK